MACDLCQLMCMFVGCDIIYPECSRCGRQDAGHSLNAPHRISLLLVNTTLLPLESGKIQALFSVYGVKEALGGLMDVQYLNFIEISVAFYGCEGIRIVKTAHQVGFFLFVCFFLFVSFSPRRGGS